MEQVIHSEIPVIDKAAQKRKEIAFLCTKYFFLVFFSFLFVFPIYVLIINSFMPNEQIMGQRSLWPNYFYFDTYTSVFTSEYLRYLVNTLLVCVLNVAGVCIASSITAYALAKMNFYGKNFIFACIMGIVLLPSTVISIPLYIIYTKLNWVGTLLPLWVPMWFGGGTMNIFLVRQFMRGVPKSYSEAASIDGANAFQIYYMIVLPQIKPILIYLAVTGLIGNWNDFQGPLMYVRDNQQSWTLSLALYMLFGTNASSTSVTNLPNIQMAVGVMMMIPCVVLFAFFQKTIMEGISAIGIKG